MNKENLNFKIIQNFQRQDNTQITFYSDIPMLSVISNYASHNL